MTSTASLTRIPSRRASRPSRTLRFRVEATIRPAPAPVAITEPRGGLVALLRRYLVHHLAGFVGALLCGCAAQRLGADTWGVALAATAGDGLGFYGSAWRSAVQRERRHGRQVGWRTRLGRLAREFAFAEVLDAVAARPLSIGIATAAAGSACAGIVLGGGAADVLFYACAWSLRSQGRRA